MANALRLPAAAGPRDVAQRAAPDADDRHRRVNVRRLTGAWPISPAVALLFVAADRGHDVAAGRQASRRAARQHQDVYFNMWRLRWFAHALATAPSHVFDGNIFYPEPRTLTYSDAMLVEGVVARAAALGRRAAGARAQPDAARRDRRVGVGDVRAGALPDRQPRRRRRSPGSCSRSRRTGSSTTCTWSCNGRCGCRWAFWALHRTLETGTWRYGSLTGLVRRAADAVQHLLRRLPGHAARRERDAVLLLPDAGRVAPA